VSRATSLAAAFVGGLCVALSMPPWGFWPLAFVGIAMLEVSYGDAPSRRAAAARGALFGGAWMYLGMAWMVQLTVPGYLVAGLAFAGYHALAGAFAPGGRWSIVGRPIAHSLVEALRFSFPFGGVPLASLGISQVSGPLAGVARVGGVVLITWVVFQLGFLLGAGIRRLLAQRRADADRRADVTASVGSPRLAAVALVTCLVVVALAAVAPRGRDTGLDLRIAAVQGGGEQGTSATEVPSALVTQRHLDATATITDPDLDLVLWPENTIDVTTFAGSGAHDAVAEQAARLGVPILVGVTEDTPDRERFTNAQIVVTPEGDLVSRYDKVRRVPFGEYVPLRSVLEALGAPIDRIGRDAVAGTGPAVVDVPIADAETGAIVEVPFAVVISWEVFFGGRARDGVEEGGQAILNPTNGASYTGTIVQTQQVASSRLRAIENGRWVVQTAPTGFTAIVDSEGDVLERSAVSERRVIIADVPMRDGFTWYTRLGDAPFIITLAIAMIGIWIADGRRRRRGAPIEASDVDHQGDRSVVDQLEAHVGAEPTGGDRRTELA
jgi:apolipoprotein N-acyltransferase